MNKEFKGYIEYSVLNESFTENKKWNRQYFKLNPEVIIRHEYNQGISTYSSYNAAGEQIKQTVINRLEGKMSLDWGGEIEEQSISEPNAQIEEMTIDTECAYILGFVCDKLKVRSYDYFDPDTPIITTYYFANNSYSNFDIDYNKFIKSKFLNEDEVYNEMRKIPLGIVVEKYTQMIIRTAIKVEYY